jgi:hypothetical protein
MIDPKSIGEGLFEWKDVGEGDGCGWLHAEKVSRAIVHMQGDDALVRLHGSLFDDNPGVPFMRVSSGLPLQELPLIPHLVRPVVESGGPVTIRLYIPRG